MLLYRIHLNPRCKVARRDLADPYQMHATLCRAYFPRDTHCPPGALLWRLEPESDAQGRPRVLIQSPSTPDWTSLVASGWLADADLGIDLAQKLSLDTLAERQTFRFRLRANPCKTVQGKRTGLVTPDAQIAWLVRKGEQHGFALLAAGTVDYFSFAQSPSGRPNPDVSLSQDQMLIGRRHDGINIRVYSVLYEGRLSVSDPGKLKATLVSGIGHGKVMGLGLLSIAPQVR
jgi:CRISPR system Cascade subunit CasE